jgi:S1-C subfamily serine protease
LGEEVVAIGFPLAGLLGGVNVTTGNVSALSGLGNDSSRIQFTAPIQPGNSGGPVLDRAGGLAGVVVSKLSDLPMIASTGAAPQNVNFAIRKEMVSIFLSTQGLHLQDAPSSPDLSVADVADAAKPSVFVVVCN